ncbi:MAG: hypothetical protein U0797_05160 [Gemmataceae bacterium]
MSAQTQAANEPFVYPADVLEFAAKQGIVNRLEPLRQATVRAFPKGTLRITFEPDAEREELDAIVYEVTVKLADEPDQREAYRRWFDAVEGIMPKPSTIIEPILALRRVR